MSITSDFLKRVDEAPLHGPTISLLNVILISTRNTVSLSGGLTGRTVAVSTSFVSGVLTIRIIRG